MSKLRCCWKDLCIRTEAIQLNHTLATLLWDMNEHLDDESRQKIQDVLDIVEEYAKLQSTEWPSITLGKRNQLPHRELRRAPKYGEAFVSGSIGSDQSLDNLFEDLTRSHRSRETGYVGQASEVQWLLNVQRQLQNIKAEPCIPTYIIQNPDRDAKRTRPGTIAERTSNALQVSSQGTWKHMTDTSFYLDSSDIASDVFIDPYELPNVETAERLFGYYINTVHLSFPLVNAKFEHQFRAYIESVREKRNFNMSNAWRAQLNLIFAIGAKCSHLTSAEWRADESDHGYYMMRAVYLIRFESYLRVFPSPSLELVQATYSMSFYLLTIGHVNRAWAYIGVSLRHAIALGLHLRNTATESVHIEQDTLTHTWWTAYCIETLINTIMGRPPAITDEHCTVPLPNHEFEKDVSSKKPYLVYRIDIARLTRKVQRYLYSPQTATQSWEFVQTTISDLFNDLDKWSTAALSPSPESQYSSRATDSNREQFLLRIDYWSTKILITQPCLRSLGWRVENQSSTSADFDTNMADSCITAALELEKMFPVQLNTKFVYKDGPWWAIVHIIMQAITVLLLEMTYNMQGKREQRFPVIPSLQRLLGWLKAMQDSDPVASRAYDVVRQTLKSCSPLFRVQVDELLAFSDAGHS
ncbi:fungal-specific transcription factor domain-containing protein [Bipolaris maydis]|nr:fungal-specific transcription factor domain-containing protein [Bipolaris maydis]